MCLSGSVSFHQVPVGPSEEDSLVNASNSLVCEWAQKLLGQDIPDVVELARYLVSNNYVNGQSHAAFAVLATVHRSTEVSPKGEWTVASLLVCQLQDMSIGHGGNKIYMYVKCISVST